MVRNPGCKEEKLTNCSVMKGKSVYWFMTLKIHGCLTSRIAAHNSSFLQLDSAFFCIDHILRQILCHAERPPVEAGFSSVQFSCSVAQSCVTLCNPMNCSMPGLLVHHQLPEFTQTHIHRVSDAIQPSHPLSSPSPPVPSPSQHPSLFQ